MKDARGREIALGDRVITKIGVEGTVVMTSWSSNYVKVAIDGVTGHTWIRSSHVTILPNQQSES